MSCGGATRQCNVDRMQPGIPQPETAQCLSCPVVTAATSTRGAETPACCAPSGGDGSGAHTWRTGFWWIVRLWGRLRGGSMRRADHRDTQSARWFPMTGAKLCFDFDCAGFSGCHPPPRKKVGAPGSPSCYWAGAAAPASSCRRAAQLG